MNGDKNGQSTVIQFEEVKMFARSLVDDDQSMVQNGD